MNTRVSSATLAIAALCLVAGPVHAQGSMRVECPLDDARRTITNPLPDEWWTTPTVNKLSATRVQEIGGRRALMCVYGSSGSIQRYEPEGYTCTAVTDGFNCRRGAAPSNPGTYATGQVELRQTYLVDLDEGRAARPGADLWFEAETRENLYLTPQNGAEIWVGDRSNRNYEGCVRGSFSASRVPLSAVPVGSYVCVRTDQGRISQFRMNAISPGSPKTLTLGYTTWNR
jgi:hypothetical protein